MLMSTYRRANTLVHTQEVKLPGNRLVVIPGNTIKYWERGGSASFNGTFEEFMKAYPSVMQELIELNVFKKLC